MTEALFEVMPTQEVKEQTVKAQYTNTTQKRMLEDGGYVPLDPTANSGIAIKTIREIL